MKKKDDFELIMEIVNRAEKMDLMMFDRLSLSMDLDFANNKFNLRLEDFLNADNFNFAHDIVGIQNNMDRKSMKMDGIFLPRFSNNKGK